MRKLIGAIFLLICVITAKAQEEKSQYIRKGLLRSMATISPGIMLKVNASTIFLHGNLEYYVADNVSLRGDSYYYINGKYNDGLAPFAFNHSTFAGASYHFKTKNNFNPYLALEPGISVTQSYFYTCKKSLFVCDEENIVSNESSVMANPLISGAIGFNFYFQRWFHLFGEARYISGRHLSDAPTSFPLHELRFSFGLGWNINLIKRAN